MSTPRQNRREFLKTSSAAAAAGTLPFWFSTTPAEGEAFKSPGERPILGCIGTGSRWRADGPAAMRYSDCVAVCDVDSRRTADARSRVEKIQSKKGRKTEIARYGDYRKVLDRKDVDVVTIVTPDHWHTKIAIEAMQAGKDIYCEKPLTLTIDEGKQIIQVLNRTKRVFQVGTQQRSEMGLRFLKAIALAHSGRIGKIKKAHVVIGPAPTGGPFKKTKPPASLDWEMWLGQAPLVDYIEKRCHYEFRWWYEYSGGKMTDWGAHHVDIAQWAMGHQHTGPVSVEGKAVHPCPFKNGYPTVDNVYNTAVKFNIHCRYADGTEIVLMDRDEKHNINNGILFFGEKGQFFVSRSKLIGKPVDETKKNPLPGDAIAKLYTPGVEPGNHMRDFFECVKRRIQPVSDVYTHHRTMTTCHLANIAIRLGRKIHWDPKAQQIIGDSEARTWQSREQRKGYEIKV